MLRERHRAPDLARVAGGVDDLDRDRRSHQHAHRDGRLDPRERCLRRLSSCPSASVSASRSDRRRPRLSGSEPDRLLAARDPHRAARGCDDTPPGRERSPSCRSRARSPCLLAAGAGDRGRGHDSSEPPIAPDLPAAPSAPIAPLPPIGRSCPRRRCHRPGRGADCAGGADQAGGADRAGGADQAGRARSRGTRRARGPEQGGVGGDGERLRRRSRRCRRDPEPRRRPPMCPRRRAVGVAFHVPLACSERRHRLAARSTR